MERMTENDAYVGGFGRTIAAVADLPITLDALKDKGLIVEWTKERIEDGRSLPKVTFDAGVLFTGQSTIVATPGELLDLFRNDKKFVAALA